MRPGIRIHRTAVGASVLTLILGAGILRHSHAHQNAPDTLPRGAITRIGSNRFWQGYGANGADFSPDGRLLATAGAGQVLIWNVESALLPRIARRVCARNTKMWTGRRSMNTSLDYLEVRN